MPRLPDIDPKDYTPDQKAVADEITAGPRGEVRRCTGRRYRKS
jgi:hypothetical protein